MPLSGLAQTWDHVIQNVDTTGTIYLTDPSWNNTLIKNCTIHNTGSGNDGIFLRSVSNVRIENCIIYDIDGQGGIRLSIYGDGTDSVQIINNTLYNLQENGINAPQRSQASPPIDQRNLEIKGNTIFNTGLGSSSGLHHPIYCQASDFTIKNNIIYGERDGNGISVRSSGVISGNIVSGKSKANKPAIRYYSDHFKGNSDTLLVENNIVYNDSSNAHTLDIFDFANLYQNGVGTTHIVKNFNIRFNTIISLQSSKYGLKVSDDFNQSGFSVLVEGNIIVNTNSLSKCISVPNNAVAKYNLLEGQLNNFQSGTLPYDFHITNSHNAYNFVGSNSTNFPVLDIDGEMRSPGALDAGADAFYSSSNKVFTLTNQHGINIYPSPVTAGNNITIEAKESIKHITIFNSNGQEKYNKELNIGKTNTSVKIPHNLTGMCFIFINKRTAIPIIVNKR